MLNINFKMFNAKKIQPTKSAIYIWKNKTSKKNWFLR